MVCIVYNYKILWFNYPVIGHCYIPLQCNEFSLTLSLSLCVCVCVCVCVMVMIDVLRTLLCTRSAKWAEQSPKVNTLQICPHQDLNSGGSDLWSNTLLVRPQKHCACVCMCHSGLWFYFMNCCKIRCYCCCCGGGCCDSCG